MDAVVWSRAASLTHRRYIPMLALSKALANKVAVLIVASGLQESIEESSDVINSTLSSIQKHATLDTAAKNQAF